MSASSSVALDVGGDWEHPRGRRRVLLTGATGAWGRATLRMLREEADRLLVTALALPGPAEDAALAEFEDVGNLQVVRGDLTDAALIARLVAQADVVLHVGGMVSPAADDHPELTERVNVGAMRNIVAAVRALPDPGAVAVVGIGSIAETGDRPVPVHWGRVGDPLRASDLDAYAQTKIAAERLLVDSGLPRWTWLRQTGILSPAVLGHRDPIVMHVPVDEVMEWVSDIDSARLLTRIALGEVDEALWGDVHNIGGGEGWRLTNWGFQSALGAAMGVRDIRAWYRRDWFATGNFHGHWFSDSDRLEQIAPFRAETFEEAVRRCVAAAPWPVRRSGLWPAWMVRELVMRPLTLRPRGTIRAIRDHDERAIRAFFGSEEAWRAIGDWSSFTEPAPARTPTLLDHGYDESVPVTAWDAAFLDEVARFRGGRLLSGAVRSGAVGDRLAWRCAEGHEFTASPRLVLRAGHWCPVCVADTLGYERQAESNRHLAQVVLPR